MNRGWFIAVVGPSGAGKDTLIREAMAVRPDLVLARRVVSRPEAPETEDFESVTPEVFEARRAAGDFVLDWQAHGLSYGIPANVRDALAEGRSVVANLSRGVIDAARARFEPFRVVVVTADKSVLATRLAARGRESAEEVAARLNRSVYPSPTGTDVCWVDNGSVLDEGVAAFLAALPQPVNG